MRPQGLTLVEVLVALALLAGGVLGVSVGLASALEASSEAAGLRRMVAAASEELQAQALAGGAPRSGPCTTFPDAMVRTGYRCRVSSASCTVVGGEVACGGASPGSLLSLRVEVTPPRGPAFLLSSLRFLEER